MNSSGFIGKPIAATGSYDIITGRAKYTSDLAFPGMLVGKLLYTQHPSAKIVSIDVDAARRIPGVFAVVTHRDILGENSYTVYDIDQPVLVKQLKQPWRQSKLNMIYSREYSM
jgi:CO/xanthine dehydrogenase Mo-binding subunit